MAALRGANIRRVLARNVQRLRTAKGMTQTELGDAAHLDQSQISNIENAKTNIKLYVVQDLAMGLGAPFAALFDETPARKRPPARE
jgi:transcriptional regulator with XRE-family HTH domain